MGFKDFMYTEKGKITGSVLAAVLISAAVFVPTSIAIDRSINGGADNGSVQNVEAWGYDDNVTSTGLRQDNWMGIDASTMIDASGTEITSMEATLLKNDSYNGVIRDEELMEGVKSTDGIGYLSMSHVSKDEQLKPLSISEDGGVTWIEPGKPEYIAAPLNMVMKVPQAVSSVLKAHIGTDAKELTIESLNNLTNEFELDLGSTSSADDDTSVPPVEYDYGTWLDENGYLQDFAMSFIAFNWVAQSTTAHEALKVDYAPINADTMDDEQFLAWAVAVFGGTDREKWGVIDETGNFNFGNQEILIDGTGTDEAAINLAFEAFGKTYEGNSLTQILNNGGSYRGWETSAKPVAGVVVNPDEYDGKNDGSQGAFIGTQSRGMETYTMTSHPDQISKGEIAYWGYDEDVYTEGDFGSVESSDKENILYDFDAFVGNESVPLATTIAGDQVVFFTSDDATFEYEGHTYTPTGISQEGAKLIYQLGASWQDAYTLGLIDAELV